MTRFLSIRSFVLRGASVAALASAALFPDSALHAQPPVAPPAETAGDSLDDATPGRATVNPTEPDVVTLPETVVTATPFPSQPLTDDVVLSAGLSATPRSQTGSSVTVITSEDIQRRGARTLTEVLRTVPGLDVTPRGGPGQLTTIFTRGTDGKHTKVLLDGVPLNDPSSPSKAFDPSNLLLDNVERVEVLRGPQSSVYGSEAIGGVINIVTKRGSGPGSLTSTFEGGSFGTFRHSTSLSGGTDRYWYSLSGSWFQNDGFSAAAVGTERDGYENGTLSGRLGFQITDDFDLDTTWRYIDSDVDIDGFPPPAFTLGDTNSNIDNEQFFVRTQARLLQLDGRLEHKAGFSFASYKRNDSHATGFFEQAFFEGDTHQFDFQSSLLLIDEDTYKHRITAGAVHQRETLLQDVSNLFGSFGPNAAQFSTGFFVENKFDVSDFWFTTVGYRHDDFSRAGQADTYRIASRLLLSENGPAVHGAIGTSFRNPSLGENAAGFGFNPNLLPEESFGWEIGAEQKLFDDRVTIDATYFRNDLDNLITFPSPFFVATNVARAFTGGLELSGQFELDEDTFFTASYTNTKTRDDSTGLPLLRRPRHKFNLGLSQFVMKQQGQVSLNYRFVGERDDFGGTLNDYGVLDAAAWWQISEDVRVFGRVDNLTDTKYQDVLGFQTARISAYAGVTIEWGAGDADE